MGDWERTTLQCHHCYGDRDECGDASKVWHMHRRVCHKTVALEAARRIHNAEYKDAEWHDGTFKRWSKDYSPEFPNHYLDGVSIWVADKPDPQYADAETKQLTERR